MPKKIPKDKAQLNILLSRDIYELLVRTAPRIYGKYKGAISFVVEDALRRYLDPHRHTQIHTNPRLSVRETYYKVKEWIKEATGDRFIYQVPEKLVDQAIKELRGSDPRTIEKWKRLFIQDGLLKPVGGFKPQRIMELIG